MFMEMGSKFFYGEKLRKYYKETSKRNLKYFLLYFLNIRKSIIKVTKNQSQIFKNLFKGSAQF